MRKAGWYIGGGFLPRPKSAIARHRLKSPLGLLLCSRRFRRQCTPRNRLTVLPRVALTRALFLRFDGCRRRLDPDPQLNREASVPRLGYCSGKARGLATCCLLPEAWFLANVRQRTKAHLRRRAGSNLDEHRASLVPDVRRMRIFDVVRRWWPRSGACAQPSCAYSMMESRRSFLRVGEALSIDWPRNPMLPYPQSSGKPFFWQTRLSPKAEGLAESHSRLSRQEFSVRRSIQSSDLVLMG